MTQVVKNPAMVRTQIMLRPDQQEALERMAERQGVSKSALIREAISAMIEQDAEAADWKSAMREARGIWADKPDIEQRLQDVRDGWKRRMDRLWR